MSKRDDGGPVMPHLMAHCQVHHESEMYPGMTIRQWYKGIAIASEGGPSEYVGDEQTKKAYLEWSARIGRIADALIAEDREAEK